MKKLIIAILAFALILCLAGCKSEIDKDTVNETTDCEDIYIWIDEETGVQYIVYSKHALKAGMGGITPRLNADGTLYTEEKK